MHEHCLDVHHDTLVFKFLRKPGELDDGSGAGENAAGLEHLCRVDDALQVRPVLVCCAQLYPLPRDGEADFDFDVAPAAGLAEGKDGDGEVGQRLRLVVAELHRPLARGSDYWALVAVVSPIWHLVGLL